MHEATEWHGVTWPKRPKIKAEAQQQVYAYERLKQKMERLKKHEDEQNFFRRELTFFTLAEPQAMRHCGMDVLSGDIIVNNFDEIHQQIEAEFRSGSMSLVTRALVDLASPGNVARTDARALAASELWIQDVMVDYLRGLYDSCSDII